MEMQQVRYFVVLAQTLNFTRAAEECNVSQPALTRAIQQLEHELGGPLIRREGRHSHLTELGQRMLPLLRQCYDSAVSAKSLATAIRKGDVSCLSIGVARTLDLALLIDQLSEMQRTFPGMQVKIRRAGAAEIAALLKEGEIELAIGGAGGDQWDRADVYPMFTEAFDLIVAPDHELAMRNDADLDLGALQQERFLLHQGADASEEDHARFAAAGIDVHLAHEVDCDRDLETLVIGRFGIGIAPSSALRSPTLRHVRTNALDLKRKISVFSVAGRPRSREASALLNLLRSADWSAIEGEAA